MSVRLHAPVCDADECPILQERIATARLDAFPRPFLCERPRLTAMTLECNHTFHAMALIYHWARNRTAACPVCRSGPEKGQCLSINRLPNAWKYSMALRTRRERRRDCEEEILSDRRMAMQLAHSHSQATRMELNIRIEPATGVQPASWVLPTTAIELSDRVVFAVSQEDLGRIPYAADSYVRLVPYTCMHILPPSMWFNPSTMDPGNNFSVEAAREGGFLCVQLNMTHGLHTLLMTDLIMGRMMGGGELMMLLGA